MVGKSRFLWIEAICGYPSFFVQDVFFKKIRWSLQKNINVLPARFVRWTCQIPWLLPNMFFSLGRWFHDDLIPIMRLVYSFSHNRCGKWVCLKGKPYWRYTHFSLNHDKEVYFSFSPLPEDMIQFDQYFSDGLKLRTSCGRKGTILPSTLQQAVSTWNKAYRLYLSGFGSSSLVTEVSKGTTEALLETEAWWHGCVFCALGWVLFSS